MKGEKQMNNKLLKKGLFLSLLALLFVFSGCNLDNTGNDYLAIIGTWENQYSKIEITDKLYTNYYEDWSTADTIDYVKSYDATIEKYVNNKFYGDETTDTEGDFGYIVVKYNGGAGNGKYGVIRWKSLTTSGDVTTMSYSEGHNGVYGSDFSVIKAPVYFDSPVEAEAGMNNKSEYFNSFSNIAKK